jgi:glycosyltransferase involved in cell wall biosynthesis
VIPAYNRGRVIARAIASAHGQRPRPPAEIIVVDDRSSDDTAARAEAAGATVLRHDTNRGPGGARNTAMDRAGQPFTAFLDSDDVWLPDHLARALPAMDDHVLVSAPGMVLPSPGSAPRLIGNGHGRPMPLDRPLALLGPENLVATSGTVVATETAREAGGFPPGSRSEDLDLWIRILERGPGLALEQPGYVYCPEEVHAAGDTAGMHAAVLHFLDGYRGRPWYDATTARRVTAQGRWDAARSDLASGRRSAALRHLAWSAAHPASVIAIARLLAYRSTARSTGARAMTELPPDLVRQLTAGADGSTAAGGPTAPGGRISRRRRR